MTTLTPRYESISGSSCSGLDGATGRTFVLSNTDFYAVIEFLKQGAPLHETLDFSINSTTNTVTFVVAVWDTDVISLRYFTSDGSAIVAAGYGYVTTSDVYRTSGITSTEISTNDVTAHILRAENAICRMTKNIYWNIILNEQSASAGGASTITSAVGGWTVNAFTGLYVWVYSGGGSVQLRKITSNTADTLTVDRAWTTTNPDNTSKFKVFYVPANFNPYVDDVYDGSGFNYMYLPYYPVKKVETLAVGYPTPTSTAPSTDLFLWEKVGKIQFKPTSQVQNFLKTYPQEVDISYWYGVDNLPYDIKRLVELQTTFQILGQQMGGTFDDPGSIGLPEVNISVGQAYINIRSSLETMKEEYKELLKQVKTWPVFA
jgi:hypothetical protein